MSMSTGWVGEFSWMGEGGVRLRRRIPRLVLRGLLLFTGYRWVFFAGFLAWGEGMDGDAGEGNCK